MKRCASRRSGKPATGDQVSSQPPQHHGNETENISSPHLSKFPFLALDSIALSNPNLSASLSKDMRTTFRLGYYRDFRKSIPKQHQHPTGIKQHEA